MKKTRTGRIAFIPYRLFRAARQYKPPIGTILRWCLQSSETSNYTYDLDELNKTYLRGLLSIVTGVLPASIGKYIHELLHDSELKQHIRLMINGKMKEHTKISIGGYGRRILRYALIRAMKPECVVEAGTDKGLGTCVIAAALSQNQLQGYNGRIYSLDLNPNAGELFAPPYSNYGTILYGDCLKTIEEVPGNIDLYIHDTYPDPEHEMMQYRAIEHRLTQDSVIISEYAHISDSLCRFTEMTGRRFLFFQERPKEHWYRGVGIGIGFKHKSPSVNS